MLVKERIEEFKYTKYSMKTVRKRSMGMCVFDSVRWRERRFKITFIFLVIYTTVQKFVANKIFYELIIL